MFKNILIALVAFAGIAAHAEIKYLTVEPIVEGNMSLRDTWDKTRQFCYQNTDRKSAITCLPIVETKEIQLKDKGNWSSDPQTQVFINALGDLREAAANYDRIFVRYLALNSNNDYVVHIFFVRKGDSDRNAQTIFEFGTVQSSGSAVNAEMTGMSFSSALEYLGAIFGAVVAVPEKDRKDVNVINNVIVSEYTPLLKIGESVVTTYLSSTKAGTEQKLP